ncbi:MAG: DNA polymerase III subunit delta [Flammeovirgaceae bacterium]|nr:DNA polymerase III subunit delta [Flammeovirgaceae bacterium]|tara:strand:- start:1734 stop:2762 length:1029 start_codon:yes stop_codon:yes gene_type:complete
MAEYMEIIKDFKAKKYAPVYFLHGEESFFINNIVTLFENELLDESQKSFNQYILYGKEVDINQIISTARKFPMMGDQQLIVVKEAQEIKDLKKSEGIEVLIHYLKTPVPSTILVFAYQHKSLDKRSKLSKVLTKTTVMMEAKKMYDNQIGSWIQNYLDTKSLKMSKKGIMMLSENIGNNLQRLSTEIDKLALNITKGDEINEQHIQNYVGINRDYNIFELQKALSFGDFSKAFKIIEYFTLNLSKNPFVLTINQLFAYFNKILIIHQSSIKENHQLASLIGVNPFFVGEYLNASKRYSLPIVLRNIALVHDTDLKFKGIKPFASPKGKESALLKELIFKLMH